MQESWNSNNKTLKNMSDLYKKLHHEHSHELEILNMDNIIHVRIDTKTYYNRSPDERKRVKETLKKELVEGEYLYLDYSDSKLYAYVARNSLNLLNGQVRKIADRFGIYYSKIVFDVKLAGAGYIIIFKHEADMVAFNLTNCFGALS